MSTLILVMIILTLYDVCLVKIAINYERKEKKDKEEQNND